MSDSLINAAQGIVDVRFTPSIADLRALMRLDPNRPYDIVLTFLSRIGAFALAASLTGAALWISGLFGQDFVQHLTFSIAGGLAGIVAFRLLAERSWQQGVLRKSLFYPTRALHILSDGHALTIADEHTQSRIAFSGIDRLTESSSHLVLYQDRTPILALPKAAFEQPEVFDAFASFLQSHMAAHHTHKSIPEKTA